MEEIQTVSETIEILTSDETRDRMNIVYKFLQMRMRTRRVSGPRRCAAKASHAAAAKTNNPELSMHATKGELDALTKIKKMSDDFMAC